MSLLLPSLHSLNELMRHRTNATPEVFASQRRILLYAPASTAVTALRKEADERIIIFSASTTRKKTRPPRKRRGQTQSGIASLSNKTCSGGA